MKRAPFVIGMSVVFLAALGLLFLPQLTNLKENISYRLDPTAERAFAYGERHFSSEHTDAYDIDRAEFFFSEVTMKNPRYPNLYHQLARISFLRGDFVRAHAQIDFQIAMHGGSLPNAYYVRGLIEGYEGKYDEAIRDYEKYLSFDPHNWAAINDYAWVLLKAGRAEEVVAVTDDGLKYFPDNAWLLNTNAIALYEIGDIEQAREQARKALVATSDVSEKAWLTAYPGNDPRVAQEGIGTFVDAARQNMHTIAVLSASSTIQ